MEKKPIRRESESGSGSGSGSGNKREVIEAMREMRIDDIRCGACGVSPGWLQVFATRNFYLLIYTIVGLIMGMFFTYSVSTISTIEKRFKLKSKETGIMLAGNDISQILFAIVVAYFGNYGNRPKWLSMGIISASISCFISALPHFIYGPGQDAIDVALGLSGGDMALHHAKNVSSSSSILGGSPTMMMSPSNKKIDLCTSPYVGDCSDEATDESLSSIGPVAILFTAQFFVGIAVASFYSLGLVYLDDNINKKDSPLYYAISMIVRVVGPVLGFFLGSKCLSMYIDLRFSPNISIRDPRWLGAWWLGYLILSGLLCVFGTLMLFFPRTLPSTLFKQMSKIHSKEKDSKEIPLKKDSKLRYYIELAKVKQRTTKPSLQKLPQALKRLFTNKIWVGNNFNTTLALLALMGYWSFKPKYLEFQFKISASTANFYTGVASLLASILGLSISGIILKIFRPGPRFISAYSCLLTLFGSASMFALMYVGCPKLNVVGPNLMNSSSLLGGCNDGCGCTERYSPVCSEDGLTTFYSPCYAGCTVVNQSATPVEYYDCKCVSPLSVNNFSNIQESVYEISDVGRLGSTRGGKAVQGYCPDECPSFFYYIAITTITKTIDSTGRIGSTLIYLRSVEEHDKGIALGMSTVLISLFAFIPAPIVMGAIVDSACIIWDETCGEKGNCWLYDSDQFRVIIHAVPAVILLISMLGDIMVFVNSKDLVLYEEKDELGGHKDVDGERSTTSCKDEELKCRRLSETMASI